MGSSSSPNAYSPFTAEEYLRALRLILPESEAEELVRALRQPLPRPSNANAWGVNFTDDSLALMSLVSTELKERVVAVRHPDAAWWARREELRQALGRPDV